MSDVSHFSLTLPCDLNDDELIARGEALAQRLAALEEAEAEAKVDAQKHKDRQAVIKDHIRKLRSAIEERREDREVECEERKLYDLGKVRVIRLDTGEVVSERKLEFEEAQESIFGDSEPTKGKKGRGR